jgi:hypothetical protein
MHIFKMGERVDGNITCDIHIFYSLENQGTNLHIVLLRQAYIFRRLTRPAVVVINAIKHHFLNPAAAACDQSHGYPSMAGF